MKLFELLAFLLFNFNNSTLSVFQFYDKKFFQNIPSSKTDSSDPATDLLKVCPMTRFRYLTDINARRFRIRQDHDEKGDVKWTLLNRKTNFSIGAQS